MARTHVGFKAALALSLSLMPWLPASAQAGRAAMGLRFGTLGGGAEAAVGLTSRLAVRTSINYFSLSQDEDIQGIAYNVTPRLLSVPLLLDLHPGAGSFRLSAGVVFNRNRAAGDGRVDGSVFIGENQYTSAEVQALRGEVAFKRVAPFAGLGFDNSLFGGGRVAFSFELGVMFHGHPRAGLTGRTTLAGAERDRFDSDLRAEEREIQDEIDDLPGAIDYYPVLGFGLKYRL
ncbi:MAG: hypothetical protein H0W29_15570 [Gemmatimonadales bacterium]|nr:hypothetical protein [Gemmatimonadales bacterium]